MNERTSVQGFRVEVRTWADRIGVEVREVRIRQMRRKWASASTAGRLTFNAELLGEPPRRRDEVIVHELVHLKVPNHGPLFRRLVRAYLGEAEQRQRGGRLSGVLRAPLQGRP
jgi:predicted metal-dependent hydrolase